jgi:hypothetical protein
MEESKGLERRLTISYTKGNSRMTSIMAMAAIYTQMAITILAIGLMASGLALEN